MKKILSILTLSLALAFSAAAQSTSTTTYYLDGYDLVYMQNPAMAAPRSFFALPVIGGTALDLSTSFGLQDLVFPTADGLKMFYNSAVDNTSFLNGLNENNTLKLNFETNILSVGIWNGKNTNPNGFTNFGIGLKTSATVGLPKSLFSLISNLGNDETYNMSGLGLGIKSYMEVALGHTQRINENLSVGGRLKFLVGLVNVNLSDMNLKLTMSDNELSVSDDFALNYATSGIMQLSTNKESGNTGDNIDPSAINLNSISTSFNSLSPSGYGAAIDLGATYQIVKGLTLNAAVIDLGFINWNYDTITGGGSWAFEGFEEISLNEESEYYIVDQFNNLGGEFDALYAMYKGASASQLEMLAATIHAGADYVFPGWFDWANVGFLYTQNFDSIAPWWETRFSLNLRLARVLGLTGSYAFSNYGPSLGAALNLNCAGLSIFLGADTIPYNYTVNMYPLDNLNLKLNFGVIFNVSKRKDLKGYVSKASKDSDAGIAYSASDLLNISAADLEEKAEEVVEAVSELVEQAVENSEENAEAAEDLEEGADEQTEESAESSLESSEQTEVAEENLTEESAE